MERRYAVGHPVQQVELVRELVRDHIESLTATGVFDIGPGQHDRALFPRLTSEEVIGAVHHAGLIHVAAVADHELGRVDDDGMEAFIQVEAFLKMQDKLAGQSGDAGAHGFGERKPAHRFYGFLVQEQQGEFAQPREFTSGQALQYRCITQDFGPDLIWNLPGGEEAFAAPQSKQEKHRAMIDDKQMIQLRGRRHRWSAWLLRMGGWRVVGDFPPALEKAVLVVAPHTSNWDFIVLVLTKFTLGVHVSFIGKHTLFWGPLGWWLRHLGGIPVDRSHPGGVVDEVVARMRAAECMYFALAPEGTRRLTAGWKTGFHRVAVNVGVPVVPVIIDAGRREVRIADPVAFTGDIDADFAQLAGIYPTATGIRARLASPIRPI